MGAFRGVREVPPDWRMRALPPAAHGRCASTMRKPSTPIRQAWARMWLGVQQRKSPSVTAAGQAVKMRLMRMVQRVVGAVDAHATRCEQGRAAGRNGCDGAGTRRIRPSFEERSAPTMAASRRARIAVTFQGSDVASVPVPQPAASSPSPVVYGHARRGTVKHRPAMIRNALSCEL